MKQNGTKKSKRPFYRSVDRTFQNDLNRFFKELAKNNHYVGFLYEQILRDLKSLSKEHDRDPKEHEFTAHYIPTTKGFEFLPLHFDRDDPVYARELDERSAWLNAKGDSGSYDYFVLEERMAKKKSRIVKRLFSLSMEFSHFLEEIHKKHRIPVHSLMEMYSVMTSEEQIISLLKEGFSKESALIPQAVPVEERDNFLLSISGQIYNAWMECLLLLSIMGIIELVIINRLLSDNNFNFEEVQGYLLETACYFEMEDKISEARSIDDLKKYVEEEFTVFKSFGPGFVRFYENSVRFWVKKGAFLESRGTKIRIDPSLIMEVDEDSDPEKNAESADSAWITARSDDDSKNSTEDSLPGRKGRDKRKKDENSKPFESDKEAFYGYMNLKLGKRWLKGLMFTYKLQGSPLDLMVYLRGIFIKLALSVMGDNYDPILKSQMGISLRTARRWNKELKEGENLIDGEFNGEDRPRSIKDLSEYDIDNIKRIKEEKQKHHSMKFLTQGQVIGMLINAKSRKDLGKKAGIRMPEYSRTTLKRKIKKMLELNTIRFHKEGTIYRFEKSQENIIKIVKELSKL